MAITSIFWSAASDDLHVVNGGSSVDLRTMLAVDDSVDGLLFANALPAGVTVAFTARFQTLAVSAKLQGQFGVNLDTTSGVVSVVAAPRIESFLVEATVTDSRPPAQTFTAFIRVNAYAGIRRIWLTPSEIHLNQGANGQKLTLLAEFTDGRMGMVNRIPGLIWVPSPTGVVGVNRDSGELTVNAAAGNATITVTLPLTYRVGPVAAAPNATAIVHCVPGWAVPRQAKLVTGSAGFAARNEVRNFAILSEGFRAGENAKLFDQAALSFVDYMRNSVAARPFGLCKDRINFWTVWVPSTEHGSSVLTPLRPLGGDRSEPVADALSTQGPVSPRTVEQLIERAGFPTAADRARGFGAQKTEWDTLYGPLFKTNITATIHAEWLKQWDLRMLDERDTAFGSCTGNWANADLARNARALTFHPFRTTRDHIDPLLAGLTDAATGNALGALWGPGTVNRAHVLLVCFGGRSGGALSPSANVILCAVENEENVRIDKTGPGMRTKLKPFSFPRTMSLRARARFVHESAHSFDLDDEYGGAPNFPASSYAGVLRIINQQPVSTTLTPGLAGIDPAKLKWNLPRIEKAAMLVQQPNVTGLGSVVEIVVKNRQGFVFDVGNVVRLRQRPLTPTSKVSGDLTVTGGASVVAGDLIKLHGAVNAVTAADFPAGSIAFVQKTSGGVGLNLIAADIAAHIKITGVALNTAFGTVAAGYVCVPKDDPAWTTHWTVQTPTNTPADPAVPGKARIPFKPKLRPFIVGAYEGGTAYHCGILHPTGACIMRQLEVSTVAGSSYEFCAVCAYVLVDALDPSKHGDLDAQFIDRRHYQATR